MKIRLQGELAAHLPLLLQGVHRATLAAALCLLAWPALITAESAYAQWAGHRQLEQEAEREPRENIVVRRPQPAPAAKSPARGSTLAQFSIPRLRLDWVLLEGTDDRTLDRSIGHIEGTASAGEPGNIGIAGHRNTHFRKLEWIRRGDHIKLKSAQGEFTYRVEWIRLFQPADMEVLDAAHGPALTLVTCFPFEYVGAAPLRLVVRALPDDETRARLLSSPQLPDLPQAE